MEKITSFRGEYRFLSNFYPAPFTFDGISYPNVEAAFQAMKTLDPADRRRIAAMADPSEAKRAGRRVRLRPDWEQVKNGVMLDLVTTKFGQNPDLAGRLLATGDAELVEGNTWRDRYWGVDAATGQGRNQLGKTLMKVREDLRETRA